MKNNYEHQKELGNFKSVSDAIAAGFNPKDFRPASLYEVDGPHNKNILWVVNRPYCKK